MRNTITIVKNSDVVEDINIYRQRTDVSHDFCSRLKSLDVQYIHLLVIFLNL